MGPTLGTLIMSSLMVTASGMVKDGVDPWRDLKRGCPASPLKNAFHASAWYLSTYRVMLKEYAQSHGISLRSTGELLAEREERNRRRFLPVGLRLLTRRRFLPVGLRLLMGGALCCPSIVFQTKRQAPACPARRRAFALEPGRSR